MIRGITKFSNAILIQHLRFSPSIRLTALIMNSAVMIRHAAPYYVSLLLCAVWNGDERIGDERIGDERIGDERIGDERIGDLTRGLERARERKRLEGQMSTEGTISPSCVRRVAATRHQCVMICGCSS